MSFKAASASVVSFFRAKSTNFFALVLTELLTALLRRRRSSLCRCRFSAELLLSAKGNPQKSYLKSEGRRSTRLHFSHSAWFFTLPFSNTVFILISPPQEQKNFWVELVVREFLLAWAICLSPYGKKNTTKKDTLSIHTEKRQWRPRLRKTPAGPFETPQILYFFTQI
jgi:hypothetical protein